MINAIQVAMMARQIAPGHPLGLVQVQAVVVHHPTWVRHRTLQEHRYEAGPGLEVLVFRQVQVEVVRR